MRSMSAAAGILGASASPRSAERSAGRRRIGEPPPLDTAPPSEPLEQTLQIAPLDVAAAGIGEALADGIEDLASPLDVDLVGNLDRIAEVGAGRTLRPAERILVGEIVAATNAAAAALPLCELLRQALRALA